MSSNNTLLDIIDLVSSDETEVKTAINRASLKENLNVDAALNNAIIYTNYALFDAIFHPTSPETGVINEKISLLKINFFILCFEPKSLT